MPEFVDDDPAADADDDSATVCCDPLMCLDPLVTFYLVEEATGAVDVEVRAAVLMCAEVDGSDDGRNERHCSLKGHSRRSWYTCVSGM